MVNRKRLDKTMLLAVEAFCVLLMLTTALVIFGNNSALYTGLIFCCVILAMAALAAAGFCLIRKLADRLLAGGDSKPCGITISEKKLSALLQMFGNATLNIADKHTVSYIAMDGDCQPAVAVCTAPFLIAAYSEEMDCVAMLRFPDALAEACGIVEGSRLVTATAYQTGRIYAADLIHPESRKNYTNMQPIVLDFIADSPKDIAARKRTIPERVWSRAETLGRAYLSARPGVARSGDPRWTYEQGNM